MKTQKILVLTSILSLLFLNVFASESTSKDFNIKKEEKRSLGSDVQLHFLPGIPMVTPQLVPNSESHNRQDIIRRDNSQYRFKDVRGKDNISSSIAE